MNTSATKWVLSTAIFCIGIAVILFFIFRNKISSDLQSENAALQTQLTTLNHASDSIAKINLLRADTITALKSETDTLNGRYSTLKNLLIAENHDLVSLRAQMSSLNLSTIDKYNADSIIRYFNNNFADSTK